jgi:hypothetical protein
MLNHIHIDVPRQAPEKLILITNKVQHLLWLDISLQVCPLLEVWIFHCIIIIRRRTSNEHYSFQKRRRRRRKKMKMKGTSNSIGIGSKLHKSNKLSGIYNFYIYGQNPNNPPIWSIAKIPPPPSPPAQPIHNNETSTKGSDCN